jgi:hypothetical protein
MFSMSRSSRLQSRFIRPHAAGSWDGLASGSNDRGGMISRTLALAAVLLGGIYNFKRRRPEPQQRPLRGCAYPPDGRHLHDYEAGPRCIVQGAIGNRSSDYWNVIESYKWVTRAVCNRHIRMRLTQ